MKHYVGLDVSKKETFICIVDEKGAVVSQERTKTDPELIAKALLKHQIEIEKVGLESGSLSHWLTDSLRKLKVPAICVDARKMASILSVQINKTDKNDAKGIAEAMRCGMYREVTLKSQKALETTTLMNSRKLLVEQKTQITNAIRGFLKTYGIRLGSIGDASFSKKIKELLSGTYEIAKIGLDALLDSFDTILMKLKELKCEIEKLVETNEEAKRLRTIPGVGAVVAMSFLAEIDDPKRFKKSRSVGAYLGMTPKQYSSGESKRQGRISKCGSAEVRALLHEAAIVLLTRSSKWSRLRAWGLKLKKKHGTKKAAMAVARKLAVIMHRMMIDETDFIYGEPKTEKKEAENEKEVSLCIAKAV